MLTQRISLRAGEGRLRVHGDDQRVLEHLETALRRLDLRQRVQDVEPRQLTALPIQPCEKTWVVVAVGERSHAQPKHVLAVCLLTFGMLTSI